MKVEINKKEESTVLKFPCLLVSSYGLIVLATKQSSGGLLTGTVVGKSPDSICIEKVGTYYTALESQLFTGYKGTITLSND